MFDINKIKQFVRKRKRKEKKKVLWMYCQEHAGVNRNDRADRSVGEATITDKWLVSRISEVLRSLRQTCRHKARNTTPSTAWRRERYGLDDLP